MILLSHLKKVVLSLHNMGTLNPNGDTIFPPSLSQQPQPPYFLKLSQPISILMIIIILAIVFFISGLLHLLARFLWRPKTREEPDETVLQLSHLSDSGVDQSFIHTLPVFLYKAIIGLKKKNPFECVVCLSEFEPDDKLRLLPICSHAFHMECLDTWLFFHSTCPLCRVTLLPPDFSSNNNNNHASCSSIVESVDVEKVIPVKLGKLRNMEGSNTTNNVDARRCFSMGSFAYVVDETSLLQVPIGTPMIPGHRSAMSECGCKFEDLNVGIETAGNGNGAAIGRSRIRKDSFSISKIWLRGKKDKSVRRTVSFSFPLQSDDDDDDKFDTRRSLSEVDFVMWENARGSGFGYDEENQSCYSNGMDSQARAPSFARRTFLWLTGRQNKVVHPSSPPSIL